MTFHSTQTSVALSGALFTLLLCAPARALPAAADAAKPPTADADRSSAEASGSTEPSGSAETRAGVEPAAAASTSGAAEPSSDVDVSTETSGGGLFESGGSSTDTAGESAGSKFELGGFTRGAVFLGKVPGQDKQQLEAKAAYGELALQLRTPKESFGDGYADVRFRYGLQDAERRAFIDVHEAYVNAYVGPIDLRLGQQIIVWGRSDAFSPTNNLTAMDLRIRSSQEDDKRIGNFAARGFLNLNPVRIEGVWQPLYQAVQFPPVALPKRIVFGDDEYPKVKLINSTAAVRAHLELPAFEMSFSYLTGYAPLPGLAFNHVEGDGTADAEIQISRVAYRQQVFGFDFSTTLGDFMGLRAEAAYRIPKGWENHINVPHPDVLYVLGLDKTFGSVSVIAQYMGRYVFNWQQRLPDPNKENPDNLTLQVLKDKDRLRVSDSVNTELGVRNQGLFQQRAALQHLASARLEWQGLHDTLSISALGMMNFTTSEWLVYPKVAYKFTDHLSGALGGEIYSGPEGSLLDLIEPTLNAGHAELKVAF